MKTKFMKRTVISMLTALVLLASTLAFAGCGKSGETDGDTEKDMVKIGIAQIVDHPSLNTIRENTITALADAGYIDGETAIIDYQDAQNEQSNLKSICQKFSAENYDIIIPIATPTAQAALGETQEIPIVFSAVTDPVGAGLVKDMNKPGGNITGVSDAVSAAKIMDLALQITPDIKTIGALYTSSEANSQSVIAELKEYAGAHGLTVVEAAVTSSNEIPQAAASLAGKVDAVFSPIDNTVAASMPIVVDILNKAKIPFYVGADSMVNDGGLATDGVNYEQLGVKTGEMAAEVLKGKSPADIPVLVMSETQYYINEKTAQTIGITIPQAVLDSAQKLGE